MNRGYKKIMGELRFSEDTKERMVDNLVAAQVQPVVHTVRGRHRLWHYAAASVAAVGLVIAIGGGAYASGALMSVGNVISDVFGGVPAQTEVVDKIGRPIGASTSSNGVTITAEAIIGDRTNYAIVYSIAKDDGTAFDGLEPLPNGLLPIGFDGGSSTYIDGVSAAGGSGYFYDADPTDNAIQYVEKMSVDVEGNSIIGKTARASFANLQAFGDGASDVETLATGPWNLKFMIDYEDTSVNVPAGQQIEFNDMDVLIDEITVSPIAITVNYTVDGAMDWEEQESDQLSEHNDAELDRFFNLPVFVTMNDGTVIDATDGGGSSNEQDDKTIIHKGIVLDQFLDLENVASITIGNTEVPLP